MPDSLRTLPLPLGALGVEAESGASEYADRSSDALGDRLVVPLVAERDFLAQFALLDLGGLTINSGRISPLLSRQELNNHSVVTLNYGGRCVYSHGITRQPVGLREALITRNDGGTYDCDYCSGVVFAVDASRLQRTLQDLTHASSDDITSGVTQICGADARSLFSLFDHVNQLLLQERWLPAALGLAEQVYRQLALAQLRQAGRLDSIARRQREPRRWSPGLDAVVDYIRSNRHSPLTMADLERISHYSARHLTTLFRERFNCTAMQFVRRQRLELAMERLRTPAPDDTVIRIARDCGYHHASNFSVDFQRQFKCKPSDVLRLSRSARPR